jgi:hypothetical protein
LCPGAALQILAIQVRLPERWILNMLNSLASPLRAFAAVAGASMGLIVGDVVVGAYTAGWLFAGILLGAAALVCLVWFLGRADKRFRSTLRRGSSEIVHRQVDAAGTAGRVRRQRVAPGADGFVLSGSGPIAERTSLVVVTALVAGPARRVACAVPTTKASLKNGQFVRVAVHPMLPEVAVLDDLATDAELRTIAEHPRWRTERLPSDLTVVGGLVTLIVYAAAGAGLGVLLVALTS